MFGNDKADAVLDALRKSMPQHGFDGQALRRALELTAGKPQGFARGDVERVEAFLCFTDGDLDRYEFVLSLSDGRRIHLSYRGQNFATVGSANVGFSVMGSERYPNVGHPIAGWDEDVADLKAALLD